MLIDVRRGMDKRDKQASVQGQAGQLASRARMLLRMKNDLNNYFSHFALSLLEYLCCPGHQRRHGQLMPSGQHAYAVPVTGLLLQACSLW